MPTDTPTASAFATAGLLLDALASQDFDHMAAALEPDATLAALLPSGFREWTGPEPIVAAFRRWFGDVDRFEVLDAAVGQVSSLLQLRWRLRVEAARFGPHPMVVEQQAYATTAPGGRIDHVSLLCSGFWPEAPDRRSSPSDANERNNP